MDIDIRKKIHMSIKMGVEDVKNVIKFIIN